MAKKVASRAKLLKDYDKLPKEVISAIKAEFPNGFSHKLIAYTTPKGEKVMALPFETVEASYLVRVTVMDTRNLMKDDEEEGEEKAPRENLDLADLDIDGLKEEDDNFTAADDDSEDEEEEYIRTRNRRRNDDDDESDDDY